MKILNYIAFIALAVGFLGMAGCGDDPPPTPAFELIKDKMAKTWAVDGSATNQVMFGTEDRTDSYTTFQLTVTDGADGVEGGNYTTTAIDEPDPWPSGGSWTFKDVDNITSADQSNFVVVRGDGMEINVTLSDTQMTLEFTYDQSIHNQDDNRIMAVDGDWKFVLKAQ